MDSAENIEMAVFVPRKKSRLSKKLQADEVGFFHSIIEKIFLRVPTAFFILVFIYIWSSSSTVLSGNIVHVCVSSRKLSSLYCLSAGTHQNLQIPVQFANDTSSTDNVEEVLDLSIKSSTLADNSFNSKSASIPADYSSADSKSSILADRSSIDSKSSTLADNSLADSKSQTLVDSISADNKSSTLTNNSFADNKSLTLANSNSLVDSKISSILAVNDTVELAYREVEEQIQLHRSWISDSNIPAKCEGRGIYVYDLPSKFNEDLSSQCGGMIPWLDFCQYLSNGGLGEKIDKLGSNWYNTHQYALEPIFHARVKQHPCRVHDPNQAKLFYVPYYGGLDVMRWHFTNASNNVKDSLATGLVRWLETQVSWYKNLGKDHVFVLGKISWDFRRNDNSSWGTKLLELDEMQNPIKLLIERHPWHVNDVGIPHPTYFHPHTDDDIIAWQIKISRIKRTSVASFAGAARPGSAESIRSILIEQCNLAGNGVCRFLNCTSGQCDRPDSIVEAFTEAEFCLQPPGDSPTRKSVFDSLISGCIPVLFDPMTAYYQYPWHLPEDSGKYSVFVDKEEVRNKSLNVVERLMKIPVRERENMRRYIVYELLPGLVYGDLDSKFDKFQDAFTITMNNLLERVGRLTQ